MQQPGYFKRDITTTGNASLLSAEGHSPMLLSWIYNLVSSSLSKIRGKEADKPSTETEASIEASKMVKQYTAHPGRALDSEEEKHADNMENLHQLYESQVQRASSLDDYFHEFLDEEGLWARNSDQVISRSIARNWWRIEGLKRAKVEKRVAAEQQERSSTDSEEKQSELRLTQTESLRHTPGDLESQTHQTPNNESKRGLWQWHRLPRRPGASNGPKLSLVSWHGGLDQDHSVDASDDDCSSSVTYAGEKAGEDAKSVAYPEENTADLKKIRQQILTVPQLWLWSFGGMSVSIFLL